MISLRPLFFAAATVFSPFVPAVSAQAPTPAPVAPVSTPDSAHIWDLTPLFADPAAWITAKDKFAAALPALAAHRGKLGDSPQTLLAAANELADRNQEFIRLYTYAFLRSDENTRDAANLERKQEMGLLQAEYARATSWVRPEVLTIGDARIREYIEREPGLRVHEVDLREILRMAPHTLGAEAENVLSASSLLSGTPSQLYGILANADLPWPTIKLSDGTEARLDQSGYTRHRAAPDRADREAVFQSFWTAMKTYERTFGVALFSQVQADWFYAQTRKHPSSLAAALAESAVPEAVYRTLVTETNAGLPTLHRYFKLRGRMLGITDLRYHDIYPTLVQLEKPFTVDVAKALTITATRPLGAAYTQLLETGLAGRYMHTFPSAGKRSGAYMSGSVHDAHPYVLMNYNDDYESVSTLAHEWGHAIHSRLANTHQPRETASYPIFTAEIASTVNEALLLDHMLAIAATDDERLFYLGSALEGLRGTFFRQAMFAEFELLTHEAVERGEALSGAKLTTIYGDLLRRYHGHDQGVLKIDDLVTVEWAYIPHFYRNFYVYQYATSIAAAQQFAAQIRTGGAPAAENYLEVLKAGGSDHPYTLVKRAGVDLATPAPYRALIARMDEIMDEMETILAKRGT